MSEFEIGIDHRCFLPAVRDQGQRPLCLSFAASDANSFAHQSTDMFSVEYLAYHSVAGTAAGAEGAATGMTFDAVASALKTRGQPTEEKFPYDPLASDVVRTPLHPSDHYLPLHHSRMQRGSFSFAKLMDGLAVGRIFILGLRLTQSFLDNPNPAIFRYDGTMVGNHAVLAVGNGKLVDGEPVILIRNSWGDCWGERGHGWITRCLVDNALITAAELEVS